MLILETGSACRAWRDALPRGARVAFVPTMGALHEGHAELLRQARKRADFVALSVFVNPLQFGAGEDYARYPRTWEADLALARSLSVDAVFAPEAGDLYPEGFSTSVEETRVSLPLCGERRPGHFRGVCTVVLKLFHLVEPDEALFGLKDVQQFLVLRQMAADLSLRVRVLGVQTVREKDGLALSSRNAYLSPSERSIARRFPEALARLAKLAEGGAPLGSACEAENARLQEEGFLVEYLEARGFPALGPEPAKGPLVVAGAVRLGRTRLIDNRIARLADPAAYGILHSERVEPRWPSQAKNEAKPAGGDSHR